MGLQLSTSYAVGPFIDPKEMDYIQYQVEAADDLLRSQTGPGSQYLGWLDPSQAMDSAERKKLKAVAQAVRDQSEVFIVIGVGGSYIGARAAIECLNHSFHNHFGPSDSRGIEIYFAGHHLSATYLHDLLDYIEGKDFTINVISKSGTTLEPSIAYRLLKQRLIDQYGEDQARQRIIITTDADQGTLREEANKQGMTAFTIPDNIGGRFTVLTAVGLLPIAVLGHDIDRLLEGASTYADQCRQQAYADHAPMQYAAVRNILYRKGYDNELFITYEPRLQALAAWWQQLFGESEGKDHMGIYPSLAHFTTDLHAIGQYIQDGRRQLFQTVLQIKQPDHDITLPSSEDGNHPLSYIDGYSLNHINHQALKGTLSAHVDGGVPNILLTLDQADEYHLGQAFYFFEMAVSLSAYVNAVNPFNQPGVEAYKNNMFALLNKPGYEGLRERLIDQGGGFEGGRDHNHTS